MLQDPTPYIYLNVLDTGSVSCLTSKSWTPFMIVVVGSDFDQHSKFLFLRFDGNRNFIKQRTSIAGCDWQLRTQLRTWRSDRPPAKWYDDEKSSNYFNTLAHIGSTSMSSNGSSSEFERSKMKSQKRTHSDSDNRQADSSVEQFCNKPKSQSSKMSRV